MMTGRWLNYVPWLACALHLVFTEDNTKVKGTVQTIILSKYQGGATYIRWGSTSCPDGIDTELVYQGFAGGSHYNVEGGASDYLCLPSDPQWGNYNSAASGLGEMYGAEYQTASFPFSLRSDGPRTLQDQNVPCAVCRAVSRASKVMIPARMECYDGWTREYQGYLTSGHKGHKGRTQYACMDAEPEVDDAGYRNEDGALFYSVDAVCGSLPCPPYMNGRELTCVVCTK